MHADAALMGMTLPFLDKDLFYNKYFHSISISGHKFLGIPFPCGVFMVEKRIAEEFSPPHVNVIKSTDCTISGSRNGHSALFMDYIFKKKGKVGLEKDVMSCIETSEFMIKNMHNEGINAWRNHNSFIVVFDIPHEDIVKKWQLACNKPYSHAVVLPHVTHPKIKSFIKDLKIKAL
jgi:histidine decarboxylase